MGITFKRLPEEIRLEDIEVGSFNVRRKDITAGLDELADSLKTYGQLQPIIVRPKDGKYEVIVGQRRYYAAKTLNWETITAKIITSDISEVEASLLSFIENSQRRELSSQDKERACKYLMEKLGSPAEVARQLGFSEATVRNWLDFSAVPGKLKQLVTTEKKITRQQAVRIAKYIDDENKAVELAERIHKINPPRQDRERLFNAIEESPKSSVDEIFKKAEEKKEEKEIYFILIEKYARLMDIAEKRLDKDGNDLASEATKEFLDLLEY